MFQVISFLLATLQADSLKDVIHTCIFSKETTNGYIFITCVWKHTELIHLHTKKKNKGIQCYIWWICYQMTWPVSRTQKNTKRKEVSGNARDKIKCNVRKQQMAVPLIMMYHQGKQMSLPFRLHFIKRCTVESRFKILPHLLFIYQNPGKSCI